MELNHSVAVVTGRAHGIGRAVCRALHKAGTRVAVADLDFKSAHDVANEIGGLALQVDVSNEREIADAVGRTESELGIIDVFISNAGVAFGDGTEGALLIWLPLRAC